MSKAVTLLAQGTPSVWMVAGLGIAVVFVGLILIVGIVGLLNKACDMMKKGKSDSTPIAPVQSAPAVAANAPIANREEIVAAVCAAVAEEEGVDISALRVHSFKKL